MFRGNNENNTFPFFQQHNHLQFPANVSNQSPLCGNVGYNVPLNHFRDEDDAPQLQLGKQVREVERSARNHKLQSFLNNSIFHEGVDSLTNNGNHNFVSTGLKLSYDDDERNSSISSASANLAMQSFFLSVSEATRAEFDKQRGELDHYIKTQEESLAKGLRDLKQRQTASLITALEKCVGKKLQEKDIELENLNRKNRELTERMKQVALEVQNWCYRAKYNESIVNVLKANLQQALQGAQRAKEGFGDSDIDDAASAIPLNAPHLGSTPNGLRKPTSLKNDMSCKTCNTKVASVLLIPCRHLCLCKSCEGLTSVCPVCGLMKNDSIHVLLS